MGASYAREKLNNAVYSLATGTDTIQRRLVDAMIAMSAVSDRDFEGERLEQWQSIYTRTTATETGPYDGSYQNTLFPMNDDDAVQLARDICELNAMMDLDAEFEA